MFNKIYGQSYKIKKFIEKLPPAPTTRKNIPLPVPTYNTMYQNS